jgi:hypothetical protein
VTTAGGTRISWPVLTPSEQRVKLARIAIRQGRFETPQRLVAAAVKMTETLQSSNTRFCNQCGQLMVDDGNGNLRCLRSCSNPCEAA